MKDAPLIKSPLRYPGGKSRAVKKISAVAPVDFAEFREPFLGGGSVYLYYKQTNPDAKFWVNDKYRDLYLFWREVKRDLPGLVREVKKLRKKYQADGKKLFEYLNDNYDSFSDKELAVAFFCYNRMTFSGTTLSGGFSKRAFSERFTPSSIERLEKMKGLLGGTRLTNDDFEPSILAAGEDVFLFLDPPYYSAEDSKLYGDKGDMHSGFDHERLASLLQDTEHKFLITYDDSEYIRSLYENWANIQEWTLQYGMRNVGDRSQEGAELFISNY
jgi:DNA adenine methylase